jgi:hypothetical protein
MNEGYDSNEKRLLAAPTRAPGLAPPGRQESPSALLGQTSPLNSSTPAGTLPRLCLYAGRPIPSATAGTRKG